MADTEPAVTTEETAPVDTEMPDAPAAETTETAAKDESTKDEAAPVESGDVKEEAAPEYVPDEPAETFQFNADIAQLMRYLFIYLFI